MKNIITSDIAVRYKYGILLCVLITIAFWFRIRNLGDLSLIIDEGYQVLAVESLLEDGIPEMDSGLIYLRGPLLLYMQAAAAHVFELNEFWLRFPSVIWGVASIIPAYILGKDLFNRPVGALVATIIALSMWEIEMSRYARPYIALQFFFLVALICFYRGFMLDRRSYRIWFLISSGFALLTHELAMVIGTLFIIPLVSTERSWKSKADVGYWMIGFGAMLFVLRKLSGFHLPEGKSFTPPSGEGAGQAGLLEQLFSTLGVPALDGPDFSYFISAIHQHPILLAGLALVLGVTTAYLLYHVRSKKQTGKVVLSLLMVWTAFLYQFGLVIILCVVYLLVYARGLGVFRERILITAASASILCFIIWVLLLVRSFDLQVVQVLLLLFGFPSFYQYFLKWILDGWPIMTLTLVIGSAWMLIRYCRNRHDIVALFLVGSLYIPALLSSLFESFPAQVYMFHLFPLVVLFFAATMWYGCKKAWGYINNSDLVNARLAFIVAIPFILLLSQDVNPVSSWAISERTYQSEKDPIRNVIAWRYYADFHRDTVGPSLYIRENMDQHDKILVVGTDFSAQLARYYVGEVHYVTNSLDRAMRYGIFHNGSHVHYTLGVGFVTNVEEMKDVLEKYRGRLWIIGDRRIAQQGNAYYTDTAIKDLIRDVTSDPDYVGRDGITFAVKVR